MKNFNRALCALFAFVVAISMGACTDPGVDGGTTKVTKTLSSCTPTPIGAEVVFETSNVKEIAYMVRDTEIQAQVIFQGGKKVAAKDGVNTISVTGLESETLYTVFFAFRDVNDKFVEDVVKVEFLTTSYGDSVLTVVDRMYDGFKVHIQVPEDVKAKGNAIRYATSSMPMYNYMKIMGNFEFDMLLFNAMQSTTKDKLVIYDEYHSIERDENGEIIYDESGNTAEFSDPKVPGEPGYFLAAEYGYMNDPEERVVYVDGEVMTVNDGSYMENSIWWYPAGWQPGYYMPMYDWKTFCEELETDDFNSEKYWNGYYERIYVETLQPQIIENGVKIEVTDLTPKEACITFVKSSDIAQYCYLLCSESEYENEILPILENKEEHLRWFVGSYFAHRSFGVVTKQEDIVEQWLTDWFKDTNAMEGQTIRVLVTGLADGEGKVQSFDTTTFTLPKRTLENPEVVVSPVKTDDPYNVTFNIKNPNYETNPIDQAIFACNYVREFDTAVKESGYTSLLKSLNFEDSPNVFSKYVISQINSKAGFDFTVPSRDAATSRLAVLVYNWEGSSNNPDESGSPAVAECTTPNANYPTRVESELFDKLQGEWIASAPMKNYVLETDADGNSTGNYIYTDAGTFQSPVTIMGGLSCPSTMPDEVWAIYKAAGMSRDEAEELYDELVSLTQWYNNRTRGFNRLLCLGYNFADSEYLLDMVATPYDLFVMEDYSASQVSYMFYDFGPKWNLEIDADGSVWLPINIDMEYPLEAYNFGIDYTFYMLAVGESYYLGGDLVDAQGNTTLKARFPVEVSADYNTITIKPIEYTDPNDIKEYFYPCVAQLSAGRATPLNPRVKGNVVLTRNTTGKAVKANASVANGVRQSISSLGKAPVPMARPQFAMTPMENIKPIKRNVLENKIEPGIEAYHKRATAAVKAYYGIK